MEKTADDEILIRRYLLGEAAEEEQSLIEQRLLTDQQCFDLLLRIEEELTDEYARGEIEGRERERFERHFMNAPERREGVYFAQTLSRYISSETIPNPAKTDAAARNEQSRRSLYGPRRRALREILLACAASLLAAISVWLMVEVSHVRKEVEQFQGEQANSRQREEELKRRLDEQQGRSNELSRQLERAQEEKARRERELAGSKSRGPRVESTVAIFTLSPGLSRAEDNINAISLSPATERLRLKLWTDETIYKSYRAEVQTAEGQIVWSRDNLKARQSRGVKTVAIELPAALLTRSDYLVVLSSRASDGSQERIGNYHFRVVRK